MDGGMNLESLMQMLGLGGGMDDAPYTLGGAPYYGGLQRQQYQADPNMMPPMMPQQGMPQPPADPLGIGGADPSAMMQMLGGLGLG